MAGVSAGLNGTSDSCEPGRSGFFADAGQLAGKENRSMTTFMRVSDSDGLAGDATHITLNELGFFSLTAVRTGAGKLKLINWRTGDIPVARVSDSGNQAGEVSRIAIT